MFWDFRVQVAARLGGPWSAVTRESLAREFRWESVAPDSIRMALGPIIDAVCDPWIDGTQAEKSPRPRVELREALERLVRARAADRSLALEFARQAHDLLDAKVDARLGVLRAATAAGGRVREPDEALNSLASAAYSMATRGLELQLSFGPLSQEAIAANVWLFLRPDFNWLAGNLEDTAATIASVIDVVCDPWVRGEPPDDGAPHPYKHLWAAVDAMASQWGHRPGETEQRAREAEQLAREALDRVEANVDAAYEAAVNWAGTHPSAGPQEDGFYLTLRDTAEQIFATHFDATLRVDTAPAEPASAGFSRFIDRMASRWMSRRPLMPDRRPFEGLRMLIVRVAHSAAGAQTQAAHDAITVLRRRVEDARTRLGPDDGYLLELAATVCVLDATLPDVAFPKGIGPEQRRAIVASLPSLVDFVFQRNVNPVKYLAMPLVRLGMTVGPQSSEDLHRVIDLVHARFLTRMQDAARPPGSEHMMRRLALTVLYLDAWFQQIQPGYREAPHIQAIAALFPDTRLEEIRAIDTAVVQLLDQRPRLFLPTFGDGIFRWFRDVVDVLERPGVRCTLDAQNNFIVDFTGHERDPIN